MTYPTNINRFASIMNFTKNHSITKKLAKTCLWISIIAILSPILFYYTNTDNLEIKGIVNFPNKLGLISPLLLFIIYLGLLLTTLKQKYERTDLNILFSLSALTLSVYLLLLYSRIFPAV